MAQLKPLVSKGKGSVAVILPDTVTSARYTEFDAPYLTKAFTTAGLTPTQFSVANAQGSDSTQFTDAQEAITKGATVLVVDPLDSGTGAKIESYAKQHGVAVIDYDRLTLGGSRTYYVSFDNVMVGTLIGQGVVSCVTAWNVKSPNVLVMRGAPTDNNATLFAQGYKAVLAPKFSSGLDAGRPGGRNLGPAHRGDRVPAAVHCAQEHQRGARSPNDENAAPIIHYLQSLGVKPKTFPVTGQDATLVGLQNILAGYQCGTAYKPIYLEAQAAAALAMYLRAGARRRRRWPTAMSPTRRPRQCRVGAADPKWVTPSNMASTVIADNFVSAKQLCAGSYASDCTANNITP